MTTLDDSLPPSLGAWRADSRRPPRPVAMSLARAAMLEALAAAPRRRGLAALLGLRPRTHGGVVVASLTSTAACTALVVAALGWNSPAGSALHDVRLAREGVELALPGLDDISLRLGFAEDRLADARAGHNPTASLTEAASLLSAVRSELPVDRTAGVWTRWLSDDDELAALEAEERPSPPGTSASPLPHGAGGPAATPGSEEEGSPRPAAPTERGSGSAATAEPSERPEPTTATPQGSAGGGGEDSGRAPQPGASWSPQPSGEAEPSNSWQSPLPGTSPLPTDH